MNRIFNVGRVAAMAAAGILAVAIGGSASAQGAEKAKVDFEGVTGLPTVLKNTGIVDEPEIAPAGSSVSVQFFNGMRLDGGRFTNVYGVGKRGTCTGCNGGVTIVFAEPVPDVSLDLTNMSGGTKNYRVWLNDVWLDGPSTPSVEQNVGNAETGRIDIPAATHGLVRSIRISPKGLSTFYIDNIEFVPGATGHEVAFRAFIPGANAFANAPAAPDVSCVAKPEKMTDGVTAAPVVVRGNSQALTSATKRSLYIARDNLFRGENVSDLVSQSITVDPESGETTRMTERIVDEMRAYAEDVLLKNTSSRELFPPAMADDYGDDCHWYHETFQTVVNASAIDVTHSGSSVDIRFSGSVATPLGGKPGQKNGAIDWDVTVTLDANDNWTVSGAHDGFPAYEVYIGDQRVYESTPGDGPYTFNEHVRKLRGGMDVKVSGNGTLD